MMSTKAFIVFALSLGSVKAILEGGFDPNAINGFGSGPFNPNAGLTTIAPPPINGGSSQPGFNPNAGLATTISPPSGFTGWAGSGNFNPNSGSATTNSPGFGGWGWGTGGSGSKRRNNFLGLTTWTWNFNPTARPRTTAPPKTTRPTIRPTIRTFPTIHPTTVAPRSVKQVHKPSSLGTKKAGKKGSNVFKRHITRA